MTEPGHLRDQLRRALHGEAWHGPALVPLVADLTAAQADARPIADAHTVHELVLHVATWLTAAARRLSGDPFEPSDAENFPAPGAWPDALTALDAAEFALDAALDRLDPATLGGTVVTEQWTGYETAHGAVQHVLYHAGQVALLRRAQGLGVPEG